jgi:hypothetical protein
MKLDPGMHIGMHLVSFGKPGVTAAYRVFRSTLQGLNQSIVGLSPLSETTYSTSHEIPNDGS